MDTIKQFAQHSGDLRRFIESGKKIIISTVQKFPFILDEIGDEIGTYGGLGDRTRRFAIVIDEAHSSQGGKTSAPSRQPSRQTRPRRTTSPPRTRSTA
jgi:type I restriction enzyme R subunit